ASVGIIVFLAGWPLAAMFLARAAKERSGAKGILLCVLMMGLGASILLLSFLAPAKSGRIDFIYAYLAATIGAFVFAAYSAHHSPSELFGNNRAALTWRCLGWAAAAALMVAYATDNLWVALGVAVIATAYYARQPWLIVGAGARTAEKMGDLSRAI